MEEPGILFELNPVVLVLMLLLLLLLLLFVAGALGLVLLLIKNGWFEDAKPEGEGAMKLLLAAAFWFPPRLLLECIMEKDEAGCFLLVLAFSFAFQLFFRNQNIAKQKKKRGGWVNIYLVAVLYIFFFFVKFGNEEDGVADGWKGKKSDA